MRTRKEIEENRWSAHGVSLTDECQVLSLEVLLDIRELLMHPHHAFPVNLTEADVESLKAPLSEKDSVEEEGLGCAAGCTKRMKSLDCPYHYKEAIF